MSGIETIARGEDSRLVELRRFVIRDPQSFAAIWSAHAGQDAVAPAVDFDRLMVAAVFSGTRPTPGYGIEVTGTRREGSDLVILVEERQPDPSHVAAQVLVSPFHVVTLPRDDGSVRFNVPDPNGQHTIIFKAPGRASNPVRAASLPVPSGSRIPDAALSDPPSSHTGLRPRIAASLAYLAGPFSGALLLANEREHPFVRFHAWQAVVGLGLLGVAAFSFLGLAFVLLIVSPTAFWAMFWLAAVTGVALVGVWALCVVSAYRGRVLKLPFAGAFAERHATPRPTSPLAFEAR
jgi:uncharacterized membrane protein